jgi:hypothetical protein
MMRRVKPWVFVLLILLSGCVARDVGARYQEMKVAAEWLQVYCKEDARPIYKSNKGSGAYIRLNCAPPMDTNAWLQEVGVALAEKGWMKVDEYGGRFCSEKEVEILLNPNGIYDGVSRRLISISYPVYDCRIQHERRADSVGR